MAEERSGAERLLAAGRAIFARTGEPPALTALAAESGLSGRHTRTLRRRLVAAGRWPWPVASPGSPVPHDGRGLTALQARWLEVFCRQGIAGGVNLMAAAREMGVSRRRAHEMYRLLGDRRGALPPLAVPRPRARDRERPEWSPSPRQIARMAAAIRASRPPGPMGEPDGRMGRLMERPGALVFDHDESRSVRGV